jgi:hypothetical protein
VDNGTTRNRCKMADFYIKVLVLLCTDIFGEFLIFEYFKDCIQLYVIKCYFLLAFLVVQVNSRVVDLDES